MTPTTPRAPDVPLEPVCPPRAQQCRVPRTQVPEVRASPGQCCSWTQRRCPVVSRATRRGTWQSRRGQGHSCWTPTSERVAPCGWPPGTHHSLTRRVLATGGSWLRVTRKPIVTNNEDNILTSAAWRPQRAPGAVAIQTTCPPAHPWKDSPSPTQLYPKAPFPPHHSGGPHSPRLLRSKIGF